MSDFRKLIGEQLRTIRKKKGLTQEQLAERTKNESMSKSRISDIENAKINISLDTLGSLMDALDLAPNELFNFQKLDGMPGIEEKKLLIDIHKYLLMERELDEVKYVVRTTKDFLNTMDTKEIRKHNRSQ